MAARMREQGETCEAGVRCYFAKDIDVPMSRDAPLLVDGLSRSLPPKGGTPTNIHERYMIFTE